MELKERIINNLKERKKKVEEGGVNCIPLPFSRFRQDIPGIEPALYYLVSGATKSGKTQLTNYLFVYNTVLYHYYNPDKIHPKIFYFPLEETADAITLRFMAFLLSHITRGAVKISPTDLRSTDERKPLPNHILELMDTEKFNAIMSVYEDIVTFYDDRNPTGVWKILNNYAKANGTIVNKSFQIKEIDELGVTKTVTKEMFDYYVPNNPEEYIFIIVDHVSLLDTERGMTLRESINKLSEYMILLRNRYNYIPVIVQQQSTETQSLDAFKNNKIRPTVAGLADSKYTARDCNVFIGITNPYSFELSEYLGYDIKTLKSKARFMEIVINRNGNANGICPLYFEGNINSFKEMPLPNSIELGNLYQSLRNTTRALFAWAYKLIN